MNAEGKAIWTTTVQSGKWQKTLTFLKVSPSLIWERAERPSSFAGNPVKSAFDLIPGGYGPLVYQGADTLLSAGAGFGKVPLVMGASDGLRKGSIFGVLVPKMDNNFFIPLLGTVFYVLLDAKYFTKPQYIVLFLQIIIITFLLPIAFFYLLRTFGKIETIMLSDIAQRKIPLLLHIMLLAILIEKSITIDRFPTLYFYFLGGLISTLMAFLLLYVKIKASIHMIGMSALTVFIVGLSVKNQINTVNLVTFFVIMNGLVATSRLIMKAHTHKELLIGILCGVLPQLALMYFYL